MFKSFIALSLVLLPSLAMGQQIQPDGIDSMEQSAQFASVPDQPEPSLSPPGLTLADLEAMALRRHPALAAAVDRMNRARGRRDQAGLYPNPVAGYHATEIGNLGTAGQQGGFISQRFITAGKLQLDQAIAGRQVDEAHFQFHAQEQRVLSDVRVRFYDALVAQRRGELTTDLARIGDALVSATDTLIEGRLGTENDRLQAEIRADEAHILRENAQNETVETWRRLVAVIGLPNMQTSRLQGELDADLPVFSWDECYQLVMERHPRLRAARARVGQMRLATQRARVEPIPNVDLSVSVRHHNVTDDEVANVQVGLPIPIFNANQGNIRSAEAAWREACHELKRMELDLQDRLAVAYRRFANAHQQVGRYRDRMVPRAEKSLALVTGGYEQGQVQYLTLLTAQQTYVQVHLAYLVSLGEVRAASSIIEGQLLSGSLAPPVTGSR